MDSKNKASRGLGVVWAIGATGALVLAFVAITARPDEADITVPEVPEVVSQETTMPLALAEVQVHVTDSGITVPEEITAGETTFIVRNTGEKDVALRLKRGDWEAGLAEPLEPGETGRFTAVLDAGIYEVLCPNAMEIEKARLRVVPAQVSPTT